jgi:hypothetical protein
MIFKPSGVFPVKSRVMKQSLCAIVAASALAGALPVHAKEQGDWLVRFGGSYISPKSNNH